MYNELLMTVAEGERLLLVDEVVEVVLIVEVVLVVDRTVELDELLDDVVFVLARVELDELLKVVVVDDVNELELELLEFKGVYNEKMLPAPHISKVLPLHGMLQLLSESNGDVAALKVCPHQHSWEYSSAA